MEVCYYVIMIEVKLCHCILYIFSLYLRFNFNLALNLALNFA